MGTSPYRDSLKNDVPSITDRCRTGLLMFIQFVRPYKPIVRNLVPERLIVQAWDGFAIMGILDTFSFHSVNSVFHSHTAPFMEMGLI